MPGLFFSFDGVDGAGKSTQRDLFCDYLRQKGHDLVTCRDPGSTQLGESLRQILLTPSTTPIHRRSEMLLYMAARAQLVEEIIRPSLAAGKTVVSDRFVLANIVYQGYAGGLDIEEVRNVGRITTAGVAPDLNIVLDLDSDAALARIARPADRMEQQGREFAARVRRGYQAEAQRYPREIALIDARGSIDQIAAAIRQRVAEFIG